MKPTLSLLLVILLGACIKKENNTDPQPEPKKPAQEVLTDVDSIKISYTVVWEQLAIDQYYFLQVAKTMRGTNKQGPPVSPILEYKDMMASVHDSVKHILNEVPAFLMDIENTYYYSTNRPKGYGVSDIRAYKNGKMYIWSIDEHTEQLPDSIKPFANRVREVVKILNRN
ncbi:MAG TPA: hypothetical protein VIN07_06910 [Flavipsychrobacter sp.]